MSLLKQNIFLVAFILFAETMFSQIQQYFFVDDVEVVEYLWVNVCIGDDGKTVSVEKIDNKTTYKNKEIIQQITDYRKGIDFLPNSKYKNSCFEYPFTIVNSKYKHLEGLNNNCKSNFKRGRFKYLNPQYLDVDIKRKNKRQIESNKDSKFVYEIEWITPCNYILTYQKVSDEKYEYLLGQKIDVKIIDILPNENYVYYSNLSDRTYGFGIIEKL